MAQRSIPNSWLDFKEVHIGLCTFGIDSLQFVEAITKEPPPKLEHPENFSADFNNFIACCLIKNPEERSDANTLLIVITLSHSPINYISFTAWFCH
jgi:serine/threonine protein kinase